MDDNKRKLGYEPDIQYEEDYYSDGAIKYKNALDENTEEEESEGSIMDNVQDNIDGLINTIPLLPIEIQTAVNQVFKPIFNDWYSNIKGNKYPTRIPRPGEPIIKPKDPTYTGGDPNGGGTQPDNGGWNPGKEPDSTIPEDPEFDPYFPWESPDYAYPDPYTPSIFTPDIKTPIIKPDVLRPEDKLPIDDDIFASSSPFTVEYEEADPIELIEMEYIKNTVDLYNFYTKKLKELVNRFILNCLSSIISANNKTGKNDSENFLLGNLTLGDTEVADNLRHLVDMGVRGEVNGRLKLNFCLNNFSLENTLYHLKNYKVSKELRRRYEEEEMMADGTMEGSKSDRALKGLRQSYDKKYDTSYINLYKHLNSSIVVLEDVLNTILLGVSSKEILFKKGGSDK